MRKQCFVIGPFGKEGSPIRRWSDSLLHDVIRPIADQYGYDANRSIDMARPRDVTSDLVARLLQADLVIADLTAANANVYYELAIRHAVERPFIHVIKSGQRPPFDIHNLDVLPLPLLKNADGVALPEAKAAGERLRPYFAAVSDCSASYANLLSGQQVARSLRDAVAEIDARRAAHDRERSLGSRLPSNVQRAIFKYAHGSPLYYSRFLFDVSLEHARPEAQYTMRVDFDIANVSDHPQTVVNRYPTPTREFTVHSASIAGRPVDLDDPGAYSGDALTLTHVVKPGESCNVDVRMTKRFGDFASDLFTAYLYPADNFLFRATNASGGSLRMWLEMLNSQSVLPSRSGDALEWRAVDTLLPNQCVRLMWRPR